MKLLISNTAENMMTISRGKVSTGPTYCHMQPAGPNRTAKRHGWNGKYRECSPEGVKHYDWLGVIEWPFWPKHHPFHCQKAINVRESSRRRQIFDRCGDHKRSTELLELRDCMYKDSQGPARHFRSQNK